MRNGFGVLENSSASSVIGHMRRARPVAVESIQTKAVRYQSQRPRKILAPIALSGDSKGAIEHAMNVARAIGADLSLLNVADSNSPKWEITRREFDSALPPNIGRFVIAGSVPETITSYAEFMDASLVLMTSTNSRGWNRFWKRSVTAKVMKSTHRPVLVTRFANAGSRFHCQRILCALALDGTDDATVLQAEALARRSGGELILLGIVPEIDEGLLHEVLSGADRPLSSYQANHRIRKIARSLIVPYKTSVMLGSRSRCIGMAARQYTPDIVVASRSELNTRAVFRRLDCPLLSVSKAIPGVYSIDGGVWNSLAAFENAGDSWH